MLLEIHLKLKLKTTTMKTKSKKRLTEIIYKIDDAIDSIVSKLHAINNRIYDNKDSINRHSEKLTTLSKRLTELEVVNTKLENRLIKLECKVEHQFANPFLFKQGDKIEGYIVTKVEVKQERYIVIRTSNDYDNVYFITNVKTGEVLELTEAALKAKFELK